MRRSDTSNLDDLDRFHKRRVTPYSAKHSTYGAFCALRRTVLVSFRDWVKATKPSIETAKAEAAATRAALLVPDVIREPAAGLAATHPTYAALCAARVSMLAAHRRWVQAAAPDADDIREEAEGTDNAMWGIAALALTPEVPAHGR